MLKIHEVSLPKGGSSAVYLEDRQGTLTLVGPERELSLPPGAVAAVMRRFGGPLDPAERITSKGGLTLKDGSTLRHVRHLSGYDVIARDYLVYETALEEPLCALATTVAAALEHLGRAVAAHRLVSTTRSASSRKRPLG